MNPKNWEVASRTTKCKHYYFYYNDPEFGWMFLKIQTWFPYNIQIYLNGREYLSRLLAKEGLSFSMYNNSFSYVEDFQKAQELADGVLNKKLSASFDGMAGKSTACFRIFMKPSATLTIGALTSASLQPIFISKAEKN